MTRQLAFDLPAQEAFRREDFFPSPANAAALASIDAWPNWPAQRLLIVGPAGAGKTHLSHLWAKAAKAQILVASDLAQADLPALAVTPVVVEDAQTIGKNAHAETALFHLHNMLAGQGLLLTANAPPRDWGIDLADLLSRMQAISIVTLAPPDDALLSAVLVKLFNDRQINVPPTLISYLVARMDRSIASARTLVAALDAQALAQGRPITRALAAELLDLNAPE